MMSLMIGGLAIGIRSVADLAFHRCERFLPFQGHVIHPQITWEYQVVPANFPPAEKADPEFEPILAHGNRPGTNSGLLHSPPIKACLENSREHADWLKVETNSGTITVLDFKKNRARIFMSEDAAIEFRGHTIGPAMLAPFLPNFDACLFHAAAIVRAGRAAVFLAPDEGGKTTAVRLAPAGTILGDDQILVRRGKDGFLVCGTPWGRHTDSVLQAPLAGLFLLEKAARFALAPLAVCELVSQLWEEIKNTISILPKPLKKKAFSTVCEIAAAVPAWKMSFPKDHIDWEAIDQALNKEA